MQRILLGTVGALLLVAPAVMLYTLTVPVPLYRTGTFADYQPFALTCVTIYGGAATGLVVQWRRRKGQAGTMSPGDVFRACFVGAVSMASVAFVVAAVIEGSPGNLWGLVVIVGGILAALVGGGAGLVWRGAVSAVRE